MLQSAAPGKKSRGQKKNQGGPNNSFLGVSKRRQIGAPQKPRPGPPLSVSDPARIL